MNPWQKTCMSCGNRMEYIADLPNGIRLYECEVCKMKGHY